MKPTVSEKRENIYLDGVYKDAEEKFLISNPKSSAHFKLACDSMPGGNTRTGMYYAPFPLTMSKGEGAYLWDLDGHQYIDYAGDFSAGLFGHSNKIIHSAIKEALSNGVTFGSTSLYEEQLAKLICARFPSIDEVRFCNSGSEANIMALVTANAITKREKVIVFEGAYHGGTLSFPTQTSLINLPFEFIQAPYNDIEGTTRILEDYGQEISAILVEPMQGAGGCIVASKEFLELLRTQASRIGAILIFDEVMTSRLGPSGIQGLANINPDMTTLGKYIGGGMTAGAFGGQRDIMAHYDPRRKNHFIHHGTFNNNVLSLAGGVAGLGQIYTPAVAAQLTSIGTTLRNKINSLGAKYEVPFQVIGYGSLMNIHFTKANISSQKDLITRNLIALDLFHLKMIEAGIYLTRRGYIALNLDLTEDDNEYFVNSIEKFLMDNKAILKD